MHGLSFCEPNPPPQPHEWVYMHGLGLCLCEPDLIQTPWMAMHDLGLGLGSTKQKPK